MAEIPIKAATDHFRNYLLAKEEYLANRAVPLWFSTGRRSIDAVLQVYDPKLVDEPLAVVMKNVADPKTKVPADKEVALRLQLTFMLGMREGIRTRYVARAGGKTRTSLDSRRYEASNSKSVRCLLNKMVRAVTQLTPKE